MRTSRTFRQAWDRFSLPFVGKRKRNNREMSWVDSRTLYTVEPLRHDSGLILSQMIRFTLQKSELQAKSRSYQPNVGDTTGRSPPKPEPNRPEKVPRTRLWSFYRKGPPSHFESNKFPFCTFSHLRLRIATILDIDSHIKSK